MSGKVDVAFFDMDHTLMDNDCDVSWKEFLIDTGIAPESEREETHRYFEDYLEGRLDYHVFLDFQLKQFRGRTEEEMTGLAESHFEKRVSSRLYPDAVAAVRDYQAAGVPVVLLTATNRIVAGPVARRLELAGILATELELAGGRFTGRIVPPYCYRENKVEKAGGWCSGQGLLSLERAVYYGDSSSDIPMLEAVGCAVMVNPGPDLEAICRRRSWDIRRWSLDGSAESSPAG